MRETGVNPTQVAKVNFWLPILTALVAGALSAGTAYGIIGRDVFRNSEDIAELKIQGSVIMDIRLAQRTAETERSGFKDSIDEMRIDLREVRKLLEKKHENQGSKR